MEAAGSVRLLVHICQTAQHHITEGDISKLTVGMYIEDINSFKMSLSYEEEGCAGCLVIASNVAALRH